MSPSVSSEVETTRANVRFPRWVAISAVVGMRKLIGGLGPAFTAFDTAATHLPYTDGRGDRRQGRSL